MGSFPGDTPLRGGEMAGFGRSQLFLYDLKSVRAGCDFGPWRASPKTPPNVPPNGPKTAGPTQGHIAVNHD